MPKQSPSQKVTTRWKTTILLGASVAHDPDVLLGYPTSRKGHFQHLSLGPRSLIRSGSVIYAGSSIGENLQTGHHVVIREENRIGKNVSVWNNTTIDYGCQIGNNVKIHCNCYIAQYSVIE